MPLSYLLLALQGKQGVPMPTTLQEPDAAYLSYLLLDLLLPTCLNAQVLISSSSSSSAARPRVGRWQFPGSTLIPVHRRVLNVAVSAKLPNQ